MTLTPTPDDYTDKDFDSLRLRLRALVQSVFPEWTDDSVANFGNILVDLYAHVGDVVTFYADNAAQESRLTTATLRRSLIALSKLVAFTPSTAAAATVTLTLSIPEPAAGDVLFLTGDVFSTGDVVTPVRFQLVAPATILAGQTSVTAVAENSENVQDVVVSTGLGGQEVVLLRSPYLDGSSSVFFVDGAYTQVSTFVNSGPTDRHYTVSVDQNDVAHLRFGDGSNGKVPVGAGTVDYRVGGGAIGNVDQRTVTRPEKSYSDTLANAVVVSVTNLVRASGGLNRMGNAQIKQRAPESVRAPVASVTREQFVINAKRVPGVARALMLTRNQDLAVPENTGHLHVIPAGGGLPTTALKNAVHTMVTVTYPSTLTFRVFVLDPRYKTVDVRATVFRRPGFTGAQVRTSVVAALGALFAPLNPDGTVNTSVNFGGDVQGADGAINPVVPWSDVFNAIRDAAGVRKVGASPGSGMLLNNIYGDVTLLSQEFPVLGTVTLVDGETGLFL